MSTARLESAAKIPIHSSSPAPYRFLFWRLLTPLEEAEGDMIIDVAATGYLLRPSVTGTVDVAGGFVRQGPFRFDDLQLHAVIDDRGIVIREAGARIAGGHVRAAGGIAFHQDSLDKYHAELQMQQVDLARLIRRARTKQASLPCSMLTCRLRQTGSRSTPSGWMAR